MEWLEYSAAWLAFLLSHVLPARPPLRPWLETRLGPRGFTLVYSLLALVALAWLLRAAGRAPHVPLWDWAPWQRWVPVVTMLPVCLILALAIARPNPFSFGGARNDCFDPERPGIIRLTRHPLLLALALWSASHIVPNGDLAHAVLFGTIACFALIGGVMIDRRKRRRMGDRWTRLTLSVGKTAPWPAVGDMNTVRRLAAGVLLYAVLIALHPRLFGVSPLP